MELTYAVSDGQSDLVWYTVDIRTEPSYMVKFGPQHAKRVLTQDEIDGYRIPAFSAADLEDAKAKAVKVIEEKFPGHQVRPLPSKIDA